MTKEKIFLMLSDVDNTITPTSEAVKAEFSQFAKEMKENENVELKFCPISGRDSEHISNIMKELNKPFEKSGLPQTIEIGVSDQGGVYAFREDPSRNRPIQKIDETLRKDIKTTFQKADVSKYFFEELNTKVINIFTVKPECIQNLSRKNAEAFLKEKLNLLKVYMLKHLGKKIHISEFNNSEVGVLEVVPQGIGKDIGVQKLIERFQKKYNIVGMCYCGDHENDLKAIDYMSRLAEVEGIKINIFLPKNAKEITKSPHIRVWQDKMGDISRGRVIRQGNFDTLKGILDAMKREYNKGNLIENGVNWKISLDDSVIVNNNRKLLEKINKKLLDNTRKANIGNERDLI